MSFQKKYLKYKQKYLDLKNKKQFGGSITLPSDVSNKIIDINDIKNEQFIQWIKDKTHNFFDFTAREEGGLITFNLDNIDNPYELTLTNTCDSDGMILYPVDMLNNIKENQIIWHTHNKDRGFKFEPPSGADFLILLDICKNESKSPLAIAIHTKGIWIYKINEELNQKQKDDFNNFKEFVRWIIETIDDIFSNPDPNTINKYDIDDLTEHNIKKIDTIEDYKDIINEVFREQLFIDFIPFDIPI